MSKVPPALLVLIFPLWWIFICVVIAHIGGWHELASSYRAEQPFAGARWRFQSGRMRSWMGYNNCLTVGADSSGLHLSMLFLFRAGHPPLFVRWDEMTVASTKHLFTTTFDFRFRAAPGIPLVVGVRLADRLKAAAGGRWPQARIEPT